MVVAGDVIKVQYGVVSAAAGTLAETGAVGEQSGEAGAQAREVVAAAGSAGSWCADGAESFGRDWRGVLDAVGRECAVLSSNLHNTVASFEATDSALAGVFRL